MAFHINETSPERALILSADTGEFDAEASVNELKELIKTAGGETAGVVIQKKDKCSAVTFLGSGKLEEAKAFCCANETDLIVCDTELSPNQLKFLENFFGIRVIDRTMLILDIFAANAKSGEGKLQVELAQLKYSLPRLTGKGVSMSRLGGGIGTRGPGETKLETDRRHIKRRIYALETNLENLSKIRRRRREKRQKDAIPTAAIVGYTNAGKSTLLNTLTNAGVLAANKLFATLDPTARAIKLPCGQQLMLIDTVGFISRLPHLLVEAFKSTLEEATEADIIIMLCDSSDSECEKQIEITKEILKELSADQKPLITVYNKCDKVNSYLLPAAKNTVKISALAGIGIDSLLRCISENLPCSRRRVQLLLPFSEGSLAEKIRNSSLVNNENYREDGIFMDAVVDTAMMKQLLPFIVEE